MVCIVQLYEKPDLDDPVIIEGLPGIGFVANIATLHLIQELKAKLFGIIHSSSFRDFAITADNGNIRSPVNELYYHKGDGGQNLILLYGNTQALTTIGQYELCWRILEVAMELGCRQIITLGGFKKERVDTPKLYCAASDYQTLQKARSLGAEIMRGQIFGVAGLLIGLGKLWGMKGLCLLAETSGYPDASAAREVLNAVRKMLRLEIDLSRLDLSVEVTRKILESFGIATTPVKRKSRSNWLI